MAVLKKFASIVCALGVGAVLFGGGTGAPAAAAEAASSAAGQTQKESSFMESLSGIAANRDQSNRSKSLFSTVSLEDVREGFQAGMNAACETGIPALDTITNTAANVVEGAANILPDIGAAVQAFIEKAST